jgi:hypothetical protein
MLRERIIRDEKTYAEKNIIKKEWNKKEKEINK